MPPPKFTGLDPSAVELIVRLTEETCEDYRSRTRKECDDDTRETILKRLVEKAMLGEADVVRLKIYALAGLIPDAGSKS